MDIIEKLKTIRKQKKYSLEEVGKLMNISYGTIRDIESKRIRLSLENFLLLCNIYETSPLELLNNDSNEHFILLNNDDIKNLNDIINKINNQTNEININDNHGFINIKK